MHHAHTNRPSQADSAKDVSAMTRRAFLRGSACVVAAGLLPSIVPPSVFGQTKQVSPSNRVTVGLIGRGAMGAGHLHRVAYDQNFQLLAVCDPDRTRCEQGVATTEAIYAAAKASGAYKGCAGYSDYRDLLARADIDAVLIASPDHWHAQQSIDAAIAGKDIYCEKPVSVTMEEGRQLAMTVRRHKRVFQTGTQYRSIPAIRKVCQFIRDGQLGRIKSVFTLLQPLESFIGWRFKGPEASVFTGLGGSCFPLDFALPAEKVPEWLDWNMWVGPAPWREYHRFYHTNPVSGVVPWSFDAAFGVASSTWFLSHSADVIQWALGQERSGPLEIIHPSSNRFPTLTCRYSDGAHLHFVKDWNQVKSLYGAVPDDARLAGNFGGVFVGERGWLTTMSTGGRLEGAPETLFDEMKLVRGPDVNIGANNHHPNWLECIHNRQAPSADEEIGHRSAALWHLASASLQMGRSLVWDPVKEIFPGDAAANRLLSRAARSYSES
jgi:hypothetical protein